MKGRIPPAGVARGFILSVHIRPIFTINASTDKQSVGTFDLSFCLDFDLHGLNNNSANFELRNRVSELEAQLAAASHSTEQVSTSGVNIEPSPHQPESAFNGSTRGESPAAQDIDKTDSRIDVLAAGVFDHPSLGNSICYFGKAPRLVLSFSLTCPRLARLPEDGRTKL